MSWRLLTETKNSLREQKAIKPMQQKTSEGVMEARDIFLIFLFYIMFMIEGISAIPDYAITIRKENAIPIPIKVL